MTDPFDLLDVSTVLTDEERDIQATVAKFLDDRVRPHIGEWFADGSFPRELAPELGKLGLLGMHLDGYGCAGVHAMGYGLACLELAAVDSGLRSFVSVRARCRCSRSGGTAPRSRSRSGCRDWRRARPSAASA